ncbi:unnamed protein product [Caenorhabditis bovis]|uniref:Uncharacterized protein n=1 Tax=Caenorhabditis bovis TaxID=2654633 RepID=A0A8S1F9P6_9PELO|nr:unnamed protein product [Caenorhabditis bovis]
MTNGVIRIDDFDEICEKAKTGGNSKLKKNHTEFAYSNPIIEDDAEITCGHQRLSGILKIADLPPDDEPKPTILELLKRRLRFKLPVMVGASSNDGKPLSPPAGVGESRIGIDVPTTSTSTIFEIESLHSTINDGGGSTNGGEGLTPVATRPCIYYCSTRSLSTKLIGFEVKTFKSHQRLSGILKIADLPPDDEPKPTILELLKRRLRFKLPVMVGASSNDGKPLSPPAGVGESRIGIDVPTTSTSTIFEIESLHSTINDGGGSTNGGEASASTCFAMAKKSATPSQFHPKPPFSCTPAYIVILIGLLLVLIVGAIHTLIDMKPGFLLPASSSTSQNFTSYSTLKPE